MESAREAFSHTSSSRYRPPTASYGDKTIAVFLNRLSERLQLHKFGRMNQY